MKRLMIIWMVFLFGCAGTMPGGIKTSTSNFDGSTEIVMTPAYVFKDGAFGSGMIKLGLHRTSNMPADTVMMKVMIGEPKDFSSSDGVQFNIDGEIVTLGSMDNKVQIEQEGSGAYLTLWAYKMFPVDKKFLQRLVNGTRVAMKVSTGSGYFEGVFSSDKMSSARPAFRDFIDQTFAVKL